MTIYVIIKFQQLSDWVPQEFQPLAVSSPNVSCYLALNKLTTAGKIFSLGSVYRTGSCSGGRGNGRGNEGECLPKSRDFTILLFQDPQGNSSKEATQEPATNPPPQKQPPVFPDRKRMLYRRRMRSAYRSLMRKRIWALVSPSLTRRRGLTW